MGMESELGATVQVKAIVADDFPHMRKALTTCLEAVSGVSVVSTAANGVEALEKVQEHRPSLVIVDLQMPVMDGFKLLRELRKTYPTMYLVAISGHQGPAVAAEAISAGANAFVSKNDLPHGLISAVQNLLIQ